MDSSASDGIDPELGEDEIPPPVSLNARDIRFLLPTDGSPASVSDFRHDSLVTAEWSLQLQPGISTYPVKLSWDRAALPAGMFLLRDTWGGTINVDLTSQDSCWIGEHGMGQIVLALVYARAFSCDVVLGSGWNLISVPVVVPDSTVSTLFPTATSQAFAYNNGYVTSSKMGNGLGYWIKSSQADTVALCGNRVTPQAIPVNAGWNMIGPFEAAAPTSAITSTPSGIVASSFFGYNDGYTTVTLLQSGKGYWVKAGQGGTLALGATGGGMAEGTITDKQQEERTKGDPLAELNRLMVTDVKGRSAMVFFGDNPAIDPASYELPPLPPPGIFDVRYASGSAVETRNEETEVEITGAEYPLRVEWRITRPTRAVLLAGTRSVSLQEDGQTVVARADEALRLHRKGVAVPTEFSLSQNYPNPFNPSTVVSCQWPVVSIVRLAIYDLLGKEVAVLVEGVKDPGSYEFTFDASDLASGVYLYRLTAGSFVQTRKMILVR
jgi:hypothetical protein